MSPHRAAERHVAAPPWSDAVQGVAWRFFAMYWGCVLVVDLARPAGPALTLSAPAALGMACSSGQRVRVGVALGFVGWLFATGFVANPSGVLALHGPTDAVRLVLLTGIAALAASLTTHRRGRG